MIITALITDITIPHSWYISTYLVANGTYEDDDWMASQVWGQITYEDRASDAPYDDTV